MGNFFHAVLYVPLYNLLMFLVGLSPGADLGLAVIFATIIVRLVLWPLSMSAARTQKAMRVMDPEMKAVREKYKDDQETQMKEMMALYKKYNIHPLASLLPVFIQLPIIIGLYWVFRTKTLLTLDPTLLYPFVHAPAVLSPLFLGLINVALHSLPLAIVAGLTQLAQAWYAIPIPPPSGETSGGQDFTRAMTMQARFMLPLIIGFVAYTSGAIALYFITTNLISILQEFIVRQNRALAAPTPAAS